MADENHNDNNPGLDGFLRSPDPHGEAALRLVESLLIALTEQSIITMAEAVEIVDTAVDVTKEVIAEGGDPSVPRASIALLEAISTSLSYDL